MILEKNVIRKQENLFTNKKIIIFGDSFADSASAHTPTLYMAWYEYLEKDYNITNHALSGTGPHYSFKEYYKFITDNEIKKEDYITIFLLSGEDRIRFPNMGSMSFDNKESWWINNPDLRRKKNKTYYETFKSEIDFLFLTMHDELEWSNFKNLGFLYMNSLLLNMKTIVFHSLRHSTHTLISAISKMDSFFDFSKLNNPNFYLYPIELEAIADEEFIDFEEGIDIEEPIRRNHFSQENHTILYENIKKFIKNDYNHIPFAKNIDYSYNFEKNRDTKTGKFIYD